MGVIQKLSLATELSNLAFLKMWMKEKDWGKLQSFFVFCDEYDKLEGRWIASARICPRNYGVDLCFTGFQLALE